LPAEEGAEGSAPQANTTTADTMPKTLKQLKTGR
jgi:hypothetical protein